MEALFNDLYVFMLIAFRYLIITAHIWMPLILFVLFVKVWVLYLHAKVVDKIDPVLLEIKIPKEIRKSPLAMELVLTQMYMKGSMTIIDAYWTGKIVPYFALEIASIGGEVHFYVWTGRKQKDIIEAQFYAQYPTIEIYEVDDYSQKVKHDLSKMMMWGCQYTLKKDDPFPIKSYVDFQLDIKATEKDQETVIDPMSTMLEYLGNLRPGEQGWIQILFRAHRDYGIGSGDLKKIPDWKKDVQEKIDEIINKYRHDPEKGPPPPMNDPDKKMLNSLHRSLEKYAFDVSFKGAYIAELEHARPGESIPGLIGCVRQYDDNSSNGFKPGWFTDFDYPWQDFRRMRRTAREKNFLEAYKQRSFYEGAFKGYPVDKFVFTTEELATLWHLPGGMITTPTIERIGSRKAEPPSNLPI